MTSKTSPAKRLGVAPLARVMVLVLIAFVTHSATIEIVHGHGRLLPVDSGTGSSLQGASHDQSTTESSRATGECLICQLQQHLFSTLLINVPGIAALEAEAIATADSFIPSQREAKAPQRGRAPPLASLL